MVNSFGALTIKKSPCNPVSVTSGISDGAHPPSYSFRNTICWERKLISFAESCFDLVIRQFEPLVIQPGGRSQGQLQVRLRADATQPPARVVGCHGKGKKIGKIECSCRTVLLAASVNSKHPTIVIIRDTVCAASVFQLYYMER